MSETPKTALTEEQTKAITDLINANIMTAVTQSIQTNQALLISAIKTDIEQAVSQQQRVVVASITSEGTSARIQPRGESLTFKILMALLPILATAALGFYIDKKVDVSKQEITTKLAIQQEFYTRKLTTYANVYEQMAAFNQDLNNLRGDPTNVAAGMHAFEGMAKFDKFRRSNSLYMSAKVTKSMGEVWEAAAMVISNPTAAKKNPLTEKISAVETAIAEDLKSDSLGKITEILNASQ
jgi:hypothetical protein